MPDPNIPEDCNTGREPWHEPEPPECPKCGTQMHFDRRSEFWHCEECEYVEY